MAIYKTVGVLATLLAFSAGLSSVLAQEIRLGQDTLERGLLIPVGPPTSPPVRVDAGDSCIIDIVLPYVFAGSLEGTAEISYRIDVKGPCAEATPGKFDEKWIARGTFTGLPADAAFVYVADVKAGGKIKGDIVLGQGLSGRLWISGSLANDQLEYRGFLENP